MTQGGVPMRSTGSGPLGALLMLAPLIAVPILAVVGIPQFAPGNLLDTSSGNSGFSRREHRVPEEPRYGDDARHDADDLFEPVEDTSELSNEFDDPLAPRKGSRRRVPQLRDDDRLAFEERDSDFDSGATLNDRNEDIADTESAPADAGFYPGDDSIGSIDNNRRRPRPKTPPQQAEFPNGKRYADNSGASADESRFDSPLSESEEENLFEPGSKRPLRPGAKQRPPVETPRDPYDAPIYNPTPSPKGAEGEFEVEDEESVAPPSPKTPPNRSSVPHDQSVEGPDEDSDEPLPAESDVAAEPAEDLTWQTATKRLRALGVGKSKQHFTYIEDRNVFLFTCSAVRLNDPAKTKRFEAEADEPLLAVRQVLQELELWQSSGAKPSTRPRTSIADRQ